MSVLEDARELCSFFEGQPQVHSCRIYGSLRDGNCDPYSDIDLELDVSGADNSLYIQKVPSIISERFDVVFADFAPSLAPEKYLVSVAISQENPFEIVDVCCIAEPHYSTLSKNDLAALNDPYEHILKLFCANLKHYLRGAECSRDVQRMYRRVFANEVNFAGEGELLRRVYGYLQ